MKPIFIFHVPKPENRFFLLSLIAFLTITSSFAQIHGVEEKKPEPRRPAQSSTSTVEVTWKGGGTVVIHLGKNNQAINPGQTKTFSLRSGDAYSIKVETPKKTFVHDNFLIFDRGRSFLDISMNGETIYTKLTSEREILEARRQEEARKRREAELERQRQAEAKKQAEAERKRQAEEQKRLEAERKRQEAIKEKNYSEYQVLGDKYFQQKDFINALQNYRKAYENKETEYLFKQIRLANEEVLYDRAIKNRLIGNLLNYTNEFPMGKYIEEINKLIKDHYDLNASDYANRKDVEGLQKIHDDYATRFTNDPKGLEIIKNLLKNLYLESAEAFYNSKNWHHAKINYLKYLTLETDLESQNGARAKIIEIDRILNRKPMKASYFYAGGSLAAPRGITRKKPDLESSVIDPWLGNAGMGAKMGYSIESGYRFPLQSINLGSFRNTMIPMSGFGMEIANTPVNWKKLGNGPIEDFDFIGFGSLSLEASLGMAYNYEEQWVFEFWYNLGYPIFAIAPEIHYSENQNEILKIEWWNVWDPPAFKSRNFNRGWELAARYKFMKFSIETSHLKFRDYFNYYLHGQQQGQFVTNLKWKTTRLNFTIAL